MFPNLQEMRTGDLVGFLPSCCAILLYQLYTADRGWASLHARYCEVRHKLGEMMLLSGKMRQTIAKDMHAFSHTNKYTLLRYALS